jgi:[ribosomal protein S5]-alanine N-acetyltransferase
MSRSATAQTGDIVRAARLYLRPMRESDATETYCRWLNDPDVNRYLESRFETATVASVRDFIRQKSGDRREPFFAIVLNDGDRHIGNIKLGPINPVHRFAEIGLLIGEKDCWGRGYATEAIEAVTRYAFGALGLHRVSAGCYADNEGSARAFEKAGFSREGVRRSCCLSGERYVDVILLGRVRDNAQ